MTSEPDPTIREPDQIRQDAARKLRHVQVSDPFHAILGCLVGEDWTTPRLVEMVISPDGHMLGGIVRTGFWHGCWRTRVAGAW